VGSVTTREPEFDREQVDLLLAHRAIEADRGPHGFPMADATSKDADPANPNAKFRFAASDLPTVDYVAKALGDAEDAYKAKLGKDTPLPHGLLFRAKRIELD
jgi:hypothetical protein